LWWHREAGLINGLDTQMQFLEDIFKNNRMQDSISKRADTELFFPKKRMETKACKPECIEG
jgi:hypothetical protein